MFGETSWKRLSCQDGNGKAGKSRTCSTHAHTLLSACHTISTSSCLGCVCVCVCVIKARFTLSFCFPNKSQSLNISFSTHSCVLLQPRLGDGVVISLHKASLQRAACHSNIYWPNKHRVMFQWKGSLFSPLTGRHKLGGEVYGFLVCHCLG